MWVGISTHVKCAKNLTFQFPPWYNLFHIVSFPWVGFILSFIICLCLVICLGIGVNILGSWYVDKASWFGYGLRDTCPHGFPLVHGYWSKWEIAVLFHVSHKASSYFPVSGFYHSCSFVSLQHGRVVSWRAFYLDVLCNHTVLGASWGSNSEIMYVFALLGFSLTSTPLTGAWEAEHRTILPRASPTFVHSLLWMESRATVAWKGFISVQFNRSFVSDSLRPHESQHPRPPCPSPTPGVDSDSCLLSRWCHSAISSSVIPLSSCPQIPLSIRVFSNESVLHIRWPKHWSFSFSISPSNEHPGWISFRMDWLDLLAVQGTLKSLQHRSSKPPIFRCSAFFTVQLSHPYMTTGKTIALTKQTFIGKVMSLLFNMLSRLVITFLP